MDDKRRKDPRLGLLVYTIISGSEKTDAEIAEALDVSNRTVAYYKTGERRISPVNLVKLLQITNTDIQKLEVPS